MCFEGFQTEAIVGLSFLSRYNLRKLSFNNNCITYYEKT